MKRTMSRYTAMLFIFLVFISCATTMSVDPPINSESDLYRPANLMEEIRYIFMETAIVSKKSKPDTWSDVEKAARTANGIFKYYFRKGNVFPESGTLTIRKGNREYSYVIEKRDMPGFRVITRNNCGLDDLVADERGVYLLFATPDDAKRDVDRLAAAYLAERDKSRKDDIIGRLSGIKHDASFDLLFSILESEKNERELAHRCSRAMAYGISEFSRRKEYRKRIHDFTGANWEFLDRSTLKNLHRIVDIIDGKEEYSIHGYHSFYYHEY